MKKTFLATLVFLFSSSIFAQNIGNHSDRLGELQLKSTVMQDKNAAVVAGNKIRNNLETLNSFELSKKLNIWRSIPNSTKLKNTAMTVTELYAKDGLISYQSIISVRYQYTVRDPKK